MPKQPLFPHTPKRKEPLFPHVPRGKETVIKTIDARGMPMPELNQIVRQYPANLFRAISSQYSHLTTQKNIEEFKERAVEAGAVVVIIQEYGQTAYVPITEPQRLAQTEKLKHFWIEENKPYGTWAIVEAWPGGTVRSPFKTKEEAIKREREVGVDYEWNLKLVPSPQEKFPKQHEALKKLYPYIIAEYHDDGDLTVRELIPIKGRPGFNLGRLYVVTTDGEVFEETQLAMILPATRGGPLSKYCCRFSDACAPPGLLEEGKFLERISWLRQHYKEKHPGMWGKK